MNSESDWQQALSQSFLQLSEYMSTHIPQLVGALTLIALGWIAAWLMSGISTSLVKLANRLLRRLGALAGNEARSQGLLRPSIVKRFVFWAVMLFFIAAAFSSLGLEFFASGLGSLLAYLPQLFIGVVIIIGGYYLASAAEALVLRTAPSAQEQHAAWLAPAIRWLIVLTAIIVGVEQLGINLQFVTSFMLLICGVVLFGIALAFGLGSRRLVSNLLAARQAGMHLKLHDNLKIADIEGRLVEITATMLIIETDSGRTLIPAESWFDSATAITQGQDRSRPRGS